MIREIELENGCNAGDRGGEKMKENRMRKAPKWRREGGCIKEKGKVWRRGEAPLHNLNMKSAYESLRVVLSMQPQLPLCSYHILSNSCYTQRGAGALSFPGKRCRFVTSLSISSGCTKVPLRGRNEMHFISVVNPPC